MDKHIDQDQNNEPVELDSDELDAEQAAELPDREALSLISAGGIGSFTTLDGNFHPQGPGGYDTTQPVEPPVN